MTAKELYKSLTPYRSNHNIHKADINEIRNAREPHDLALRLGTRRRKERFSDELWARYRERGKDRDLDQTDVFVICDILGYEPDPTTQWPSIEHLLRKAKDRALTYSEYERTALDILIQERALPDFCGPRLCKSSNFEQ